MQDPQLVAQTVLDAVPDPVRDDPVLADTAQLLAAEILQYAVGTVPLEATEGGEVLVASICSDLEAAVQLAKVVTAPAGDDRPRRVVEISTGAGFPGFVLSRLCPAVRVDVIEKDPRRVWFLKRLINLATVRNLHVKMEGLDAVQPACDLVLVQHASIAASVRQGGPLLRPGGTLALWQDDEPHEAALLDAGREFQLSVPAPYVFASRPLRGQLLMLASRPDEAPAEPPASEAPSDEDPVSV